MNRGKSRPREPLTNGALNKMVSAKRIIADFKVFSRGYLRNKFGLFFGLAFPIILILIFGAIFSSGAAGTLDVYVQNQDSGPVSTQFLKVNFTDYLSTNAKTDALLIPANFSADYLAAQPVNVTVYGNPSASTSGIVLGVINAVSNQFNLQRFNGTTVIAIRQSTVGSQSKNIDFLIPGLIGFSILVNPMFSLVNISSEYKKNKIFKQLSLTPLTKMEWLISKIMFYIVLSTVSFLIMVTVGILAFDANITLTVWLIPFLIIGPTLFASLGMLVGTITKNPETAGVIGNIVTFPMMFLSGTFFPINFMPDYLRTVAHALPLFYVIEGLNNVMVYANYMGAVFDLAVVGVITVIIFIAAVKLFKWRED
jgi:ABC-2 type transport system permease protein